MISSPGNARDGTRPCSQQASALPLNYILRVWFSESGSCYIAQAGLELSILQSQPPNAGITGVHHYVQHLQESLSVQKKGKISDPWNISVWIISQHEK
jgi:hypothetical protein